MQARLFSPIACRCAGMRTSYLDLFRWDEEARSLEMEAAQELLARQRLELWGLLDEPAYAGCLASMNPDVFHQLEREHGKGRATKARSNTTIRKERLLYRFLARFVGRNDQTGLAGTSLWGYFAEGDKDLRVRVQDEPPHKERVVYVSPAHLAHFEQWVLRRHALGSCTVRMAARLRLVDGGVLDTASGRVHALGRAELELVARCREGGTVGELTGNGREERRRVESLLDRGVLEILATPAPLVPMDRGLAHALERLQALPGVSKDDRLMEWFEELSRLEAELRTCDSLELGERLRDNEARIADVTEYRSLDPAESLRRLIARCVAEPECASALRLVPSARFEGTGQGLSDASTGETRPLTAAEATVLDAFAGGATVTAALGATPSPEGSQAMAALVAADVLALEGADPWRLRGPSRSDVPWDPWERRWFAHALQALEDSDIPERYKETARLLGSCRAVEQKSYEAVFPEVSPVSACNLTCDALSELGVEPAPARKDHSFFLVDSMLRDARFQISGELRTAMEEALGPFLALVGMRAWEWEEGVLIPRLTEAVPRGGAVPLAEALRWVSSWAREWRGPFQGDVRPDFRVSHDADEHILGLSELRLPGGYERWRADKRLVSCVDLMVAGDRKSITEGRWRLVLNEAHSSGDGMPETMHIPWTSYATEGGFATSHAEEVFGSRLLALQPLLPTKQAHSIAWQLRGAGLAVRSFGTAHAWEGPVLPVADLSLERTGEGFQVTDGQRRWAFLTVDLALGSVRGVRYSPLTLAGRLAQLAGVEGVRADDGVTVLPEIVLGELTVCRRQHVVPAGILRRALNGAEGLDLLHAADALRDRLDLSRFVFVSLFKEKPFLCDLESLFSMEVLAHAQRHNTRDVLFSEMDPAPEDLWLEVAGAPVASELRFAATLDGGDYRPGGEPVLRA